MVARGASRCQLANLGAATLGRSYKTVHRRFQQWCEREVLREILTQLANALRERDDIDE